MEPFSLSLEHQLTLLLKLLLILINQPLKLLDIIPSLIRCASSHKSTALDLLVHLIKL